MIVNVAEVFPAATATEAGTVAAALLLDSFTVIPPVGAAPFKVTAPVEVPPPATVEGLTEIDDKPGGFTVRTADFETDPRVPVIVAVFTVATGLVLTVKLALALPVPKDFAWEITVRSFGFYLMAPNNYEAVTKIFSRPLSVFLPGNDGHKEPVHLVFQVAIQLRFGNSFGNQLQYHEWTSFISYNEFCFRACV